VNEQRFKDIKAARALTEDAGVIEPNQIMIEVLNPQLKCFIDAIERLDKEIKQRYKKQNDRKIFDSFPGAGPQLAPRLFVAFGLNRERYQTASEVQKYAGVAPVIERIYARPLLSGPVSPCVTRFGRGLTTNSKRIKASPII